MDYLQREHDGGDAYFLPPAEDDITWQPTLSLAACMQMENERLAEMQTALFATIPVQVQDQPGQTAQNRFFLCSLARRIWPRRDHL